jgi:hypothetical protein
MAILPVGFAAEAGGYQIERSLRFNSADSAYLNRTPSGAGTSATIWTFSWWQKGVALTGSTQVVFGAESGGARDMIRWDGNGTLEFFKATSAIRVLTPKYRDPSAWYHFVINVSGTTVGVYVNGVEVTAFATSNNPSGSWYIGQNNLHRIGLDPTGGDALNGYLAEVQFIDGQALTPSSFGETDTDTGVWKPKAYSGSYGTNGFYLDFGDNSSTTALGYDAAGSNDWTPNNFSVTAGAGNDSLVDSPTRYGTDTGAGGEVRGNYATLNPLQSAGTLSNGNLDWTGPTGNGTAIGTLGVTSGKWYFECNLGSTSNKGVIGLVRDPQQADINTDGYSGNISGRGYAIDFETSPPKLKFNGTATNYGTQPSATSDILMVALDLTNNSIFFGMNGTWFGSSNPATNTSPAYSSITAGTYFPFVADQWGSASSSWVVNFGQRPFAYTAPSGFKALCTTNLPEPTIAEGGLYFNAVPYTGNSSTQTISGVGFQPDFTWLKGRSYAGPHKLFDAVRGATKSLSSNLTDAEVTDSDALTAFTSDGFSLGADGDVNRSADGGSHISWNWKANGAGSSNTAGTISSTVSANTTAGFSVVTYTGNGSNGASVGHGLGVKPTFWILKQRSGTQNWLVSHSSLSATDAYLILDSTSATLTNAPNIWTADSSKITFTTSYAGTNNNGSTYVLYAFAPIAGYSAFGSYTGNGSTDGPFIYTGFRPKFIIWKASSATDNWVMTDTSRSPHNAVYDLLLPNSSAAESTYSNAYPWDFLSNGFKIRHTASNVNGTTYIYAAFAENPFKYALAR